MQLPFTIARRYLFAKKSTNAINVITGISVLGLTIGTAALIIILSVFNGFQDLLLSLYSSFDPEVKVTPVQGKTFASDSLVIDQIRRLEDVVHIAQTLEEVTLLEYNENRRFGTIKGVDSLFNQVVPIDSTLEEGSYLLKRDVLSFGVFGIGLANRLGVEIGNAFNTVNVYMAKKQKTGFDQPFRKQVLHPSGTFMFLSEYDTEYVLTNLGFVQRLLGSKNQLSALEIKLRPEADVANTKQQIQAIVGADFHVKDRREQHTALLKIMNMEKWMSTAIFTLVLFLIAFNMIGALGMIVLEKKRDLSILKSMGMQGQRIRNIFLYEGSLMSALGLGIGFAVSLIFYALQKAFGIIPIPDGFVVDAYPISLHFIDFLRVTVIVLVVGFLASIPAALRAQQISAMVRED